MPLARRNSSSDMRTSSPSMRKSKGSDFHSTFADTTYRIKLMNNLTSYYGIDTEYTHSTRSTYSTSSKFSGETHKKINKLEKNLLGEDC